MNRSVISIGIALFAFAALTAADLAVFRGMAERNRLESRNGAERTMNVLFSSLRDYENFGSAIQAIPELSAKVIGVGAYASDGRALYAWGRVPARFADTGLSSGDRGEQVRKYLENSAHDSLILLLGPGPGGHPPPRDEGRPRDEEHSFFFTTLHDAAVVYLEISESGYWRQRRVQAFLLPVVEAALLVLVAFVRSLVLRNGEYRRRIEEQRNLVILGTAASTLAHEIKNPLLSIRLQTGILEKTAPGARREIDIINDEVERLSALSRRVGDYLRDPAGSARPVDAARIAAELGLRRCGRELLTERSSRAIPAFVDPERLRSILENLLQNALESGGSEEGIAFDIFESERRVEIDVLDRGPGVPPESRERVFDPFYTTKSRGSGIGLAICRRFALAAGGTISIEGREGGGARARLRLPAAPRDGEAERDRRAGPEAGGGEAGGSR
ncbi:MAG TPA: HAMP domain-containing sensor histidine kinase [Rectinemataceae bacterium]|nr:HAMP domain-containing sensor histidine kinase [Rectinemataceae bacterium]